MNVSARHFSAETLVRDVRVALRDSGLPPDQLVLELTETTVAEDPTRAEDQLTVLRSFGVRVAIDDFGTGWSSLAQLFALPIGTLKIDRSLLNAAERAVAGETGAVLQRDRRADPDARHPLGRRGRGDPRAPADGAGGRLRPGPGLAARPGRCRPRRCPASSAAVQAAGGDLCALAVAGRRGPARPGDRPPYRAAGRPRRPGPPRPPGTAPSAGPGTARAATARRGTLLPCPTASTPPSRP